jgi:hypothetical protein
MSVRLGSSANTYKKVDDPTLVMITVKSPVKAKLSVLIQWQQVLFRCNREVR